MIPPFDKNGYLPPGIHPATLDEIQERFGSSSEMRKELMRSLRWLVDLVRSDDVRRLIVNGSFVTAKPEPEDVDCVLLIGPTFGQHGVDMDEWRAPLPYIHLEIADQGIFDDYVNDVFASDTIMRLKGMIEVLL